MFLPSSNCEFRNLWLSMLLVQWSFHPDRRHLTPIPTKESWVRWTGLSYNPSLPPLPKAPATSKSWSFDILSGRDKHQTSANPDVVFHTMKSISSQLTSISNSRKGSPNQLNRSSIHRPLRLHDPSTNLDGPPFPSIGKNWQRNDVGR